MKNFSISVIVPVYNECDAIADSVNRNITVLQKAGVIFEIIIVDDGSNDSSLQIINSNFNNRDFITIIPSKPNRGFGHAVRAGMSIAKHQYILCVPVDSPLNSELFEAFYNSADKGDIIASYRKERKGYTTRMKLNSFVYHWLISLLFSIRLKDYNWIHLYNRRIFDERKFELTANGIFVLAEVLVQAKRNKYSIIEIAVDQEMRLTGIATASKISTIIKTLAELVKFYLH